MLNETIFLFFIKGNIFFLFTLTFIKPFLVGCVRSCKRIGGYINVFMDVSVLSVFLKGLELTAIIFFERSFAKILACDS